MSSNIITKSNPKTAVARNSAKVRTMAQIAMLTAIAEILMLFEIPLPFAPAFYEIDLSEVPILIGCFAMGPLAGVIMEALKIFLNFLINGTMTAGIGELANFAIGCSMLLPAALIYQRRKSCKTALIGMGTGTVVMTIVGGFLNAFVLLPAYAAAFGGMEAIVQMGTAVNGNITGVQSFVLFAVVPFNLLKGVLVSAAAFLLYKRVSRVLFQHI